MAKARTQHQRQVAAAGRGRARRAVAQSREADRQSLADHYPDTTIHADEEHLYPRVSAAEREAVAARRAAREQAASTVHTAIHTPHAAHESSYHAGSVAPGGRQFHNALQDSRGMTPHETPSKHDGGPGPRHGATPGTREHGAYRRGSRDGMETQDTRHSPRRHGAETPSKGPQQTGQRGGTFTLTASGHKDYHKK